MTDALWLLKKRGLYYRPNDCGYTGIRDYAGTYTLDEAKARASNGVSMVRLDRAPEFSDACFDDLARDHLVKQRDAARAEVERLRVLTNGHPSPSGPSAHEAKGAAAPSSLETPK